MWNKWRNLGTMTGKFWISAVRHCSVLPTTCRSSSNNSCLLLLNSESLNSAQPLFWWVLNRTLKPSATATTREVSSFFPQSTAGGGFWAAAAVAAVAGATTWNVGPRWIQYTARLTTTTPTGHAPCIRPPLPSPSSPERGDHWPSNGRGQHCSY